MIPEEAQDLINKFEDFLDKEATGMPTKYVVTSVLALYVKVLAQAFVKMNDELFTKKFCRLSEEALAFALEVREDLLKNKNCK